MDNNTITFDVDEARALVADALAAHASWDIDPDAAALLKTMSENVRGWTHTTRLRDFLDTVTL